MDKIFEICSISHFHEFLGYEKPQHPLITLIDLKHVKPNELFYNQKYVTSYYTITLKNGVDCQFKYGRKYYDFCEGSLMFMSPGQVAVVERAATSMEGWMLCFHPDLIRGTTLGDKICNFTFFNYGVYEALHLSETEKQVITDIVNAIKKEYCQNIDLYSRDLIVSNIELLLNYSNRFYGRQFLTRTNVNKDVLISFDNLLSNYFEDGSLERLGMPSVKYFSERLGYSANYLSDLLKKETGKSTQEHLQYRLLEKAKNLLLGTSKPIKQIAYMLGYEAPAHFSKFFKQKIGMSPTEYRK